MAPECRHIKTDGEKCHAVALRGKPYCFFHMRLHKIVAGARKPTKSKDRPIDFTFTDSPAAIQLGVYQVLSALGSLSVEPRRAGQMLYALQVATQNVEDRSTGASGHSVHCVTQTAEGEEMGPECSDGVISDCGKCDQLETCDVVLKLGESDNPEEAGKPLPSMPQMLRDALLCSLSGLSGERYQKYKELMNPQEPTPAQLKTSVESLLGRRSMG
jgi:hypothetical protein